jgi:hypothetical protein
LYKGYHKEVVEKGEGGGEKTGKYKSYSPLVNGWKKVDESGEVQYAYSYEVEKPDGTIGRLGSKWRQFAPWDVKGQGYPGGTAQWILDIWNGKIQPEVDGKEKIQNECCKIGHDWSKKHEEIEETLRDINRWDITIHGTFRVEGFSEFPKYTHTCDYPGRCEYQALCHEGEQPFGGTGRYQYRIPHHAMEREMLEKLMKRKEEERRGKETNL